MKIAVTLGDPAGIGPEVALKAAARLSPQERKSLIFIGPSSFYNQLFNVILRREAPKNLKARSFASLRMANYFPHSFPARIVRGCSNNALTRAAVRSIELAVELAMRGKVDAIVTPPINKAGLQKAGFNIPGHTEFLAALSKTKHYEMMLVGGPLRVVLVTRHVPLKDVPHRVTRRRVEETILMADRELRRSFGIRRPRLVVCGLNPHAGEKGYLGSEEIKTIEPAVRAARKKTDAEITGPLSPDSLFHEAYAGRYDAEICMYHDQGLIPLKMISRGAGVNVTLGLPFVRTSPDHGTGYDIAGSFRADPGSMLEAIQLAIAICQNRRSFGAKKRASG